MLRGYLKNLMIAVCAAVMMLGVLAESSPCEAADSGLGLTGEERAYVETAGSLKVGYVQDRIPLSFKNEKGELAGISRYIFDRIQQMTGLTFEYVALPDGDVTYQYLMQKKLSLVTSVEYNRENQGARGILISNPYFSGRKVVVARKDFNFSYDANLSVAISSGSQTIKKVLKSTYPNYSVIDYDSIGDCFSAVNDGEADMMMLNQYVAEYWLYKPSYENLKVIPVLGMDDLLCFSAVVPYDENGNPVGEEGGILISVLNKAIAQLADDEIDSYTIQSIMENRYSFTPGDFLYRYRYTLVVLLVAIVLIVALLAMLLRQRILSADAKADARAKSQFLSAMSHEIRTPLNGLIGLNYLMARRLDDKKQLSRYIDQSEATAKYLLSLVNDILDMSLLHNEDVKIEQKPVDLKMLLSAVEAVVQTGMTEKRLNFRMQASLPYPDIIGDGVRIQQVLLNLLDNARKFTPEGGSVTVTAKQSLMDDGRIETFLSVTDTGKGMSEAFQKNIFDDFSQERDTVSSGDQGVGLGLSICHRLAKLMGGTLDFESRVDQGSVFRFSFPAVRDDAKETTQREKEAGVSEKPGILVAEDNELNGDIMMELLEENGYPAALAMDGAKALQIFSQSPAGKYGVILMDLLMPNMDGFEAAKAIRALEREDAKTVRIMACSANCTAEDRRKAFESGMDDFLAKPVDIEVLLQKLEGVEK